MKPDEPVAELTATRITLTSFIKYGESIGRRYVRKINLESVAVGSNDVLTNAAINFSARGSETQKLKMQAALASGTEFRDRTEVTLAS